MSTVGAPVSDAHHGAVLARGAFFNAIAFLASNLRGIFTLLVARLLGSAILGTFGLAWAATDLISKISTFGLDTSAIAFVARAEAVGDRAGSRRVMRAALAISIVLSAAIAIGGALLLPPLGRRFGYRPELTRALVVVLFALPGIAWYRVSNAVSRGMTVMHHDIYSRGLTESLATPVALLAAVALGLREMAPEAAVIAGTLASAGVAFGLMRRLLRDAPRSGGATSVRALVRDSAPIAMYDFLNIGIMQIDVLMLGLFVGRAPGLTLETLGIYAAAVEIASGVRKVNQAFAPIFTPVVARQMRTDDVAAAQESFAYLGRWMLAILLPAVAVFVLAGGAIMTIYGRAFVAGGTWLAILGVACAMNAFVGLGEVVLMLERPRLNLVNSSAACAGAIALNLVLIPRLGPLGAAIGMLVPYTIYGVLRALEISWLFDWRWPWRALLKPAIAAGAALPLGLIVRLAGSGLVAELAAGIIYLAAYFAVWRTLGLEPRDRDVLEHLLGRAA